MLKLDQSALILEKIRLKKTIFKMVGEVNHCTIKTSKSRELIQRQILTSLQKQVNIQDLDPLMYGQKELKEVMSRLEEQLKTVYIPEQHIEDSAKKIKKLAKLDSKNNDMNDDNIHIKKQRVDKNKCRVCKNSTIPTILDILNQAEEKESNQLVTMKSIRQQIVSKQTKKEEQSDSKVPYIAFEYSGKIVICKRCRFKFHKDCVDNPENINDWICDYCLSRIKELKSCNLWDYVNNKQLKISEQKKQNSNLIERIQKKQKIFIIEEYHHTSNNGIKRFLQRYPKYRNENGDIKYPVLEDLAISYNDVLSIQSKPKPYMNSSEFVEQILIIQTIQQILFPKMNNPQTVNEEYIQKNFYELLFNFIELIWEELQFDTDVWFTDITDNAYYNLLLFMVEQNEILPLLQRTWLEFLKRIEEYVGEEFHDKIYDPTDLSVQDQVEILMYMVESVIDCDKMRISIEQRENQQNKQSQLKTLFHSKPQAFTNCSAYLGQDYEESLYFYFTHVPSSIFVETDKGWGQYALSDLQELMSSLNPLGVHESNLLQNLKLLSHINLNDHALTPTKPQLIPKSKYRLEISEVIEYFLQIEDRLYEYLDQSWCSNESQRNQFVAKLTETYEVEHVVNLIQKFYNKLIVYKGKMFNLFKRRFHIANHLGIYIDNLMTQEGCFFALSCLHLLIEEYIENKEQKKLQQKKQQQQKRSNRRSESIKEQQSIATRREKRENAGKKYTDEKKKLSQQLCSRCNKAIIGISKKCNSCKKVYHNECMMHKKEICHQCNIQKKK